MLSPIIIHESIRWLLRETGINRSEYLVNPQTFLGCTENIEDIINHTRSEHFPCAAFAQPVLAKIMSSVFVFF